MPAASVARTSKVNTPSGSPERSYDAGVEHAAQSDTRPPGPDMRQSTWAPGSAEKPQAGVGSKLMTGGVDVKVGAPGAVVSSS